MGDITSLAEPGFGGKLGVGVHIIIMKAKGFSKIGKYDYGATFDKAVYKSSSNECQVIFSVHPYDYPLHGVRFEQISNGVKVFERQYLFEDGDLEFLINTLARDLETGDIVL